MTKFYKGFLTGVFLGISLFLFQFIKWEPVKNETFKNDSITIKLDQPEFFLYDEPTIDLLFDACQYYKIQYPEIVIAQAILETGNFKSNLCLNQNNLFGLYNSHRNEFFAFDHWTKSVKAYYDKIQYRYHSGDYYEWLQNIGYAEDTCYVSKLKYIKEKYNL